MRVVVIGGGVIGLSTAWELARRGHHVSLLERDQPGRATSWAAAGILPTARLETATDAVERLRGISHAMYPAWCDELYANSGIDCGLRQNGGVYLASSPGEAASLVAGMSYQRDLGLDIISLTPATLAALEPSLKTWAMSSQFKAATFSKDEWQVRPPDLLAALVAACRLAGVEINTSTTASVVMEQADAVATTMDSAGNVSVHHADWIIVCGGAWSGLISQAFGLAQGIIPVRGQMLLYRFDSPPLNRVVNEGHRYFVPRDDGHILVGSCEEEVGLVNGTTDEMLEPLARWAQSMLPSLVGREPVKRWSGLRPGTFDGFPIIGTFPGIRNLQIASGHYRSGIHLAPATARIVADDLEQVPGRPRWDEFGVGRFLIRHAERK